MAIVKNLPLILEEMDITDFQEEFTKSGIFTKEEFYSRFQITLLSRRARILKFAEYILQADEEKVKAFYRVINQTAHVLTGFTNFFNSLQENSALFTSAVPTTSVTSSDFERMNRRFSAQLAVAASTSELVLTSSISGPITTPQLLSSCDNTPKGSSSQPMRCEVPITVLTPQLPFQENSSSLNTWSPTGHTVDQSTMSSSETLLRNTKAAALFTSAVPTTSVTSSDFERMNRRFSAQLAVAASTSELVLTSSISGPITTPQLLSSCNNTPKGSSSQPMRCEVPITVSSPPLLFQENSSLNTWSPTGHSVDQSTMSSSETLLRNTKAAGLSCSATVTTRLALEEFSKDGIHTDEMDISGMDKPSGYLDNSTSDSDEICSANTRNIRSCKTDIHPYPYIHITASDTTEHTTDDLPQITKAETNFLRITSLVLKLAPRAVRQMFNCHIPPQYLDKMLLKNKEKLRSLLDKRVISKAQWTKLYPINGNASSLDFDLTLMCKLLREISGKSIPRWNILPLATDMSDGAHLTTIMYYRNMIAHSASNEIEDMDFLNVWQRLNQAVIHVGGQGFTDEVENMLTTTLDQSYEDLSTMLKNLKEFDITLPNTIQDIQSIKFGVWAEEDKLYLSTRATNAVKDVVDQRDLIMVSGPPGSGKSATVHHIALQLKEDGYRVVPVMSAKEIIDYWMPEVKQVFVLDDPFGVNKVDDTELNQWKNYQETLQKCFQYSHMKILATVHSHIRKHEKVSKTMSFLQHKLIDITSADFSLSDEERQEIFCKHSKFHNRDDLENIGPYTRQFKISSFPLLCRIYCADKEFKHSVDDFFSKPLLVIEEDIKCFQMNDPIRYFCLLFCMIHDNNLDSSVLALDHECKDRKRCREAFLELCGLPTSLSRVEIRLKLDTLLKTFLKTDGKYYHFIHDTIHDAVVRHIGQSSSDVLKTVLRYCSSKFIKERICLRSLDCKDTESCIVLEQGLESSWGSRLLRDIKEGHWHDVFNNTCLSTEKGDQILAHSLEKMEASDIEDIMCYALGDNIPVDELFRSFDIKIKLNGVGCSSFYWSVLMGLKHVVDVTLKYLSASAKHRINSQINPLLLAGAVGEEDIVKMLISSGFDVDQSGIDKLTPLHVSAGNRYDKVVKLLLDYGADVNKCNNHGCSPLYLASMSGHYEVVQILIESRADVNKCDNDGCSPLYIASMRGHDKVVQILIDKGADVNIYANDGCSPIYVSSERGHDKVVQILIDNGADVNKCSNEEWSPLYVSSHNGHDKVVKLLLESGADVNKCSNEELSPLHVSFNKQMSILIDCAKGSEGCSDDSLPLDISSCNGHDKIVKVPVDNGANVNKCNSEGLSPLDISSCNGHDKIVEMLIDNGANVNKCNSYDLSPLYVSSCNGHDKVVKLLINSGANVNRCQNDGLSPLYMSSCNGHDKVVKLLIDSGANVNQCQNDGLSPLYISSCNGHDKVVKLLIDSGANRNQCQNDGLSPLHISACNGHVKVIKLLIGSGANVNEFQNDHFLPLCVSSCNGHERVVRLLLESGATVNKCCNDGFSPLFLSSFNGHDKVVKLLIESEANVNQCCNYYCMPSTHRIHNYIMKSLKYPTGDINYYDIIQCLYFTAYDKHCKVPMLMLGSETEADLIELENDVWSPLLVSSLCGHDKIVRFLLDNGADVNKCNNVGMSPLYISSYYGHDKVVKLLIDFKSSVNQCDNYDRSPLYVSSSNGHQKVVKLLIDNGADVNKCDSDGKLPLFVSSRGGYDKIVKLLIDKGSSIIKCDKFGYSPLHVSLEKKRRYEKITQLLIGRGGDAM